MKVEMNGTTYHTTQNYTALNGGMGVQEKFEEENLAVC